MQHHHLKKIFHSTVSIVQKKILVFDCILPNPVMTSLILSRVISFGTSVKVNTAPVGNTRGGFSS